MIKGRAPGNTHTYGKGKERKGKENQQKEVRSRDERHRKN